MNDEFAFIERWLSRFDRAGGDVSVGPGDDAAVLRVTKDRQVVATTDAFVEKVHFFSDRWPPRAIGYKALAVNLSDLASMGALPRFALLALGLPPHVSDRWLDRVADGMAHACRTAEVELVGGNVSRSEELSLTLTLLGEIDPGKILKRSGARPDDVLWVSGTIGDSALGLASLLGRDSTPKRLSALEKRHCYPEARVALGRGLAQSGSASAAIDVSDGLLSDLRHLLVSSNVGARIELARLPLSRAYAKAAVQLPDPLLPALTGGEDYELLFTSRPNKVETVLEIARRVGVRVRRIGEITRSSLVLLDEGGRPREIDATGWRHR